MPEFLAVETVGREVLLIKDNKIIGEGRGVASYDYIISIQMIDERAKALIKDSPAVKGWAEYGEEKMYRWSTFRFNMFDGSYIDDDDRYFEPLENVRVVDKHYFELGICPKSFKEAEGFRKIINEIKDAA
jgi:hypothetical protein